MTLQFKKPVKAKIFVHVCACLCFLVLSIVEGVFFASRANASTLFFHPQNEVRVEAEESITVEAHFDTKKEAVNALDVTLTFPKDLLEALDVSRGESAVTLWISDPVINNLAGTVRFTGGIPGGGVFDAGLLGRVTFRAKAEGEGMLGWHGASVIYLHDGAGTADALEALATPLVVTEALTDVPKVSSITHNDQTAWYRSSTLFVAWPITLDALYSYALDHDPRGVPDEIPDTPEGDLRFDGSLKYEGLTDGVYYFHLRQGIKEEGAIRWSRTRTFRAQIDTVLPGTILGEIGSDPTVYSGKLFVSFSGTDAMSGIDHYEVQGSPTVGWVEAVSPHELLNQKGEEPVRVRVFDKAGNFKEIAIAYPKKPARLPYSVLVVLAIVLVILSVMWMRRRKTSI